MGDPLGAEQHWAAWLEANPDHPEADAIRTERLEGWIAAGWWANAVVAGKKAPEGSPMFARALRARAASLARWTQRRVQGGGPLFRKETPDPRATARTYLDELRPYAASDDPVVQDALLRLAMAGRRPYAAQQALVRLEALGQRQPVADAFWVYVSRGDTAAVDRILEGPTPSPVATAARLRLARRPEAALDVLRGVEGTDADFVRADCLADLGRLTDALDAWTAVAQAAPDHPSAYAGLGLTYLRRGLPELAVDSLLKSLTLEENPAARSNLAAAFAAIDQQERAREVLESLEATEPVVRHQLERPAAPGMKRAPLAVLPLDVAGGTTSRVGLGDLLATLAVTALVDDGAKVVERARIDDLTAELDLSASSYIDPDAAVELGRLVGAKRLVLGNVAEFPDRAAIDLRLVEVKSGKILGVAEASAPLEIEALRRAMADATRALVK
jgi:tetratricopeptide (TPR) repeat protein